MKVNSFNTDFLWKKFTGVFFPSYDSASPFLLTLHPVLNYTRCSHSWAQWNQWLNTNSGHNLLPSNTNRYFNKIGQPSKEPVLLPILKMCYFRKHTALPLEPLQMAMPCHVTEERYVQDWQWSGFVNSQGCCSSYSIRCSRFLQTLVQVLTLMHSVMVWK